MPQDQNNLIWLDMEMTGLSPETDHIIEVALVVTDAHLNTIAEGPVLVVNQSQAVLDGMDKWNRSTHQKSGLIDKVKASTLTDAVVKILYHLPPDTRDHVDIAKIQKACAPAWCAGS